MTDKTIYYFKGKPYSIISESKLKTIGIIEGNFIWVDNYDIGEEWTPVIIYQCEYDNPEGKIWVRTKKQFLELFKTEPQSLNDIVDIIIFEIKQQNAEGFVKEKGIPHHGAGTGIRNKYNLWWNDNNKRFDKDPTDKPPLIQWFNERDIFMGDDLSGIISEAVKAKLNGQEYDPTPTIERYKKHWTKYGFKDGIYNPNNKKKDE
jgi:hypothetical protein